MRRSQVKADPSVNNDSRNKRPNYNLVEDSICTLLPHLGVMVILSSFKGVFNVPDHIQPLYSAKFNVLIAPKATIILTFGYYFVVGSIPKFSKTTIIYHLY